MGEQSIFLVIGGDLSDPNSPQNGDTGFVDPENLHIVGTFSNYQKAYNAWRAVSQQTVDNALRRYFLLPLHRLAELA